MTDKQVTAAPHFPAAAEAGSALYQSFYARPEESPGPCRIVAFLQAGLKSFDLRSEGWV